MLTDLRPARGLWWALDCVVLDFLAPDFVVLDFFLGGLGMRSSNPPTGLSDCSACRASEQGGRAGGFRGLVPAEQG